MAPRDYGSIPIKQEDDDELVSLNGNRFLSLPGFDSKHRKKYLWIAGLTVLVIVGGVLVAADLHNSHDDVASNSHSREKHNSKADPVFAKKDQSTILSDQSPMDLGFASISRADDAMPSEIWGNRTGPLPTNAWYLVR